jgi:hypothetical protein
VARGRQQQRRRLVAATGGERELGAEQVDPGAVDVLERAGLGDGQQLAA